MWEDSTFTSIWANLYPGAFFQFTTGLMGAPSLWTFIRPLMVGPVGFKFTSFHLSLFCITLLHSFTVSLSSFCRVLVMSAFAVVKLPWEMNSLTLWV